MHFNCIFLSSDLYSLSMKFTLKYREKNNPRNIFYYSIKLTSLRYIKLKFDSSTKFFTCFYKKSY